MLETMRKHSRSLLVYLIFGILIMVFIISFGPQSGQPSGCGGATGYVAKVNGREISETSWRYGLFVATGAGSARDLSGPRARRERLKEQILDALIERELMAQTAEALGFRISQPEIEERITEGDVYLLGRKTSSKQLFWEQAEGEAAPVFRAQLVEGMAKRFGFANTERFVEELRKELLAQKARDLTLLSVRVSPEEVQKAYEQQHNTVDFHLVAFETVRIRDQIEVTPAEIDERLKTKEAELKQQYDKTPDSWKGRDKEVRIRHIYFKGGDEAKQRATAALAKIKGGMDFAQAARTLSDDERYKRRGGDVGWRPLASLRFGENVTTAAGKLEKGQVSDVIQGPEGFHIIQLVDVRQGDLSFDMVKRDLAEDAIREEKAKAEAKKQAEDALAKAKAGSPLEKQFSADPTTTGPRLQTFNDVERRGDRIQGMGASAEAVAALFDEVKPGELLPKVYEVAGDYYVLQLVTRREPDMKKFQEEKPKLTAEMSLTRGAQTLFWWQGMRCQEARARNAIQFNPAYVTYSDTDDKGKETRYMSYIPCELFVQTEMAQQ